MIVLQGKCELFLRVPPRAFDRKYRW